MVQILGVLIVKQAIKRRSPPCDCPFNCLFNCRLIDRNRRRAIAATVVAIGRGAGVRDGACLLVEPALDRIIRQAKTQQTRYKTAQESNRMAGELVQHG